MPTDAEITQALSENASIAFRFERRTLGYGFLEDVSRAFPADKEQSIALQNDRAIPRTARFTMLPQEATIDLLNDHIAVSMDMVIDGVVETFALGLFHLSTPEREYHENGYEVVTIGAMDVTTHLVNRSSYAPVHIAAGTNYLSTVGAILTDHGLAHDLPSTEHMTPVDFTWPQATPWVKIINDLLFAINHYPIAPDVRGVFKTRERVDPALWSPAIHYQTGETVLEPFQKRGNPTAFANRVTVKIDDPLRTPAFATKNNNDSSSSISQLNTGQVMLKELSGGRVPVVAADGGVTVAGEIADFEIRDQASRVTEAVLRTVLDPRREVNETYRLTIEGVESETVWKVVSWSMPLQIDGVMQHQLHPAVNMVVT